MRVMSVFDIPPRIGYNGLMPIYKFDDEELDISKELERAVIKRYLEKRFITTLWMSCLLIGFLAGVLASA